MKSPAKSNPVGFRSETGNRRGRAHREEDKAKVRQAFVEAGRQLMASDDPATVSLRRIAVHAGYSPATIYRYFLDHHALLFAIREVDMDAATERLQTIAQNARTPVERVRGLLLGTVDYWLEHLDQFDLLFTRPPGRPALVNEDGLPFGESPVVQRLLKLYYEAVEQLFPTLASPPLSVRIAADTLIATTYGLIAFPRSTRTMQWSGTRDMAEAAIEGLLASWTKPRG